MSTVSILLLTLSIILSLFVAGESQGHVSSKRKPVALKEEKLSHLHFYIHDTISGRHPTSVQVASGAMTKTSSTFFGAVYVVDDPLTVGPEPNTKEIGRAQGMDAPASLNDLGIMMVINFVFTEGKHNGSTLSILGRNAALSPVREMPVVGGSGHFRFARGYAQAKTHFYDVKTGDAVAEYNVYVFHQ